MKVPDWMGAARSPGPTPPPRGQGRGRRPHCPHTPSPAGVRAVPIAPWPSTTRRPLPVLAGRDDAVLLGDEQRGRDGVLVPLDLAQQHRTAALRPGVDLGRHVRAAAAKAAVAASPAGGPSADGRAGGRGRAGSAPAPGAAWAPRRRKLPSAAARARIAWGSRAAKTRRTGEGPRGRLPRTGNTRKVER